MRGGREGAREPLLASTIAGTPVGAALRTCLVERMDAARFRAFTGGTLDVIGAGYLAAAVWAVV